MAVWINIPGPQLVGLPPLSDETYVRLDETMREIYAKYKQMGASDPSDFYII